ncbi:ABC transporter permease [Virgibacillus necropolis]|uniref:ABC transporter permease n=1 Tax=Virgibacillus necropolis TaxID=163877 RepID=UPI00384CED93
MQWTTLLQKEVLENWRNFKWVWVPLVMILIACMDPISTYYLPQIIDAVGGLPNGSAIDIPEFLPSDIIMMSLGQFSSLGVLMIVLMSMGAIASERKSGVLELILVKPVTYKNYITAKWMSLMLLVWIAFSVGMLANWYYVNLLFGDLSFVSLLKVTLFYGLWLSLVISFSVFYNALVRTPGLVAFLTILSLLIMSIVTNIFANYLEWSPSNISEHIQQMLVNKSVPAELLGSAGITIILIALLLIGSIITFKSKELAN